MKTHSLKFIALSLVLFIPQPAKAIVSDNIANIFSAARQAANENPVTAGIIGGTTVCLTAYLYSTGKFHSCAHKLHQIGSSAITSSETAHSIAAGIAFGTADGLTTNYLDRKKFFPWSWMITIPARVALLETYQNEMKNKKIKVNPELMNRAAQITSWITYLSGAGLMPSIRWK